MRPARPLVGWGRPPGGAGGAGGGAHPRWMPSCASVTLTGAPSAPGCTGCSAMPRREEGKCKGSRFERASDAGSARVSQAAAQHARRARSLPPRLRQLVCVRSLHPTPLGGREGGGRGWEGGGSSSDARAHARERGGGGGGGGATQSAVRKGKKTELGVCVRGGGVEERRGDGGAIQNGGRGAEGGWGGGSRERGRVWTGGECALRIKSKAGGALCAWGGAADLRCEEGWVCVGGEEGA